MSKIGVSLKINVNDIDKKKLFRGEKGTYLNLVTFIDIEEANQYGNHGMVKQQGDKNEEMLILGNSKIFWRSDNNKIETQEQNNVDSNIFNDDASLDDGIPF